MIEVIIKYVSLFGAILAIVLTFIQIRKYYLESKRVPVVTVYGDSSVSVFICNQCHYHMKMKYLIYVDTPDPGIALLEHNPTICYLDEEDKCIEFIAKQHTEERGITHSSSMPFVVNNQENKVFTGNYQIGVEDGFAIKPGIYTMRLSFQEVSERNKGKEYKSTKYYFRISDEDCALLEGQADDARELNRLKRKQASGVTNYDKTVKKLDMELLKAPGIRSPISDNYLHV